MTAQPAKRITPRKRSNFVDTARVSLIEVLGGSEGLASSSWKNPVHWRREFHIPLRHGELRHRLSSDERLSGDERRLFLQLCKILAATFHYEYHERIELLKSAYEPFDPDSSHLDPAIEDRPGGPERDRNMDQLFTRLTQLCQQANYHKLSQSQIEQAVAAASDWGVRLDVDFSVFERLEVYARGDVIGRRVRHRWQNFYKPEEVDVPIYQRLLVIFQLRQKHRVDKNLDSNAVYIKLFKNIPKEDVDMMLPGVRAKMSLLDSGKILFPTLSGLALAIYKIALALLVSAVLGIAGVVVLLGGVLAYASRSVFGYLNTRNKYQLNLTRSLYFQSLDNSSGVLLRLTDEAEQQEFYESILAYFLLWRDAGEQGMSQEELDRSAESYLSKICGYGIDFDVEDALAKLKRLGMVQPAGDGRWRAVSIQESLAALDKAWDAYFEH